MTSKDEKFEYFISQTNAELVEIKMQLRQLLAFRYMILGMSLAVSMAISSVFGLIEIYIMHKG